MPLPELRLEVVLADSHEFLVPRESTGRARKRCWKTRMVGLDANKCNDHFQIRDQITTPTIQWAYGAQQLEYF